MSAQSESFVPLLGWRLSPRLRPFARLALVGLLVLMADQATEWLGKQGLVLPTPVVTAFRIAAAATILRYPLAGFVLAVEVDKWDWYWLGMPAADDVAHVAYQSWDKIMDLVMLTAAAVVTLRWEDRRAKFLALGTYALRVLGVAAFALTGQRWLLIAFPNVFESVFLLYVIFHVLSRRTEMLTSRSATVLVALALLIPKVAQEVFLHALETRPWKIWHILPWPPVDAWMWGALMFAPPLTALVVLVWTAHGRPTKEDPELEVSALLPDPDPDPAPEARPTTPAAS